MVPPQYTPLLNLPEGSQEVDFSQCRELPFVVVRKNQEMRTLFEKLCATHNFHPNIAAEVVSLTTAWAMACSGVAATILPAQFVNCRKGEAELTVLDIRNAQYTRQPAIITRKGQYISAPARYAINALIEKSRR